MDYEEYEEANYWYAIFSFVDVMKRYGEVQVMFDLEDAWEKVVVGEIE